MTKQMIAVNSQHAGDRKKDNRGYAESWTSEQLDGLLSEGWLKKMVADIRGGNEKLKDKLPYICPHYGAFKDNHRAQKDIVPESFTFMTCVDVDDVDKVERAVKQALELNSEKGGEWEGQVLRIAYSARKKVHIYIRMPKGKTIEETQRAFCDELEDVPFDESCITPERFIFVTGKDEEIYRSEHWLEALSDDELEERREAFLMRGLDVDGRKLKAEVGGKKAEVGGLKAEAGGLKDAKASKRVRFIAKGVMKEKGLQKSYFLDEGGRHNAVKILLSGVAQLLTKEETNAVLQELMPDHWMDQNIQQLVSDFYANYAKPGQRLYKYQEGLFTQSLSLGQQTTENGGDETDSVDDEPEPTVGMLPVQKLPQGVRDSVEAAGENLAMAALVAVCPCIGALATGVRLDVHRKMYNLNLISYIAGDFASGKGNIDPLVDAWMVEVKALSQMYLQQEEEWASKKRAAKNKKEQPEEPKLPIRYVPLNTTVAKLAERLANTEGQHAFSFTPEADTVAQKFKTAISDFSLMLRQSYDGSRYDREAKSVDAVSVHIKHLLWNVTMCGTPDALYRVINNYTDGFQSRIAVARTPDNTFAALEDNPPILTEQQEERIRQVAHLLPLMQGEVVLPRLESKGRAWLERIRLETMKNDDRTKARQRIRICVTTQRMTCCLMLCRVCEQLIQKHGVGGAETRLKQNPDLWKEMLLKTQTPQLLELYDVIADSLMENALFFFRDRIEQAFNSRNYGGSLNGERKKRGKNDSIFERLDVQFTFEQAMQHSVAMKGADVTHNTVRQMLKNWKKQGLVDEIEFGKFRKK